MLDVIRKKQITTRKDHTCNRCAAVIDKATQAIEIVGKEDNVSKRMYLHPACHKLNVKEGQYNQFRFK